MKNVIIKLIKKYKWLMLLQSAFIILNIYLLTIPPELLGNIVDLLYNIEQNYDQIIRTVVYLIGTTLVLLLVRVFWKYYDTYIPRKIEADLKNKLFNHLMKIPMSEIQKRKNGEIMAYFVQDIREMRVIFRRAISYGVRIISTGVIVTAQMIINVDLKLTIFTLIPIVCTSFLVVKIRKYIELSYKKARTTFSSLSEYVQESADSIRTTKAYSQEKSQVKEFIILNKKLRGSNNSVDVHSTLLTTCVNICFGLCYGISIIYGSRLVIQGEITIGSFVAFNSYITLFVDPISWIPGLVARFKRAKVSYERMDEIMSIKPEPLGISQKSEDDVKLQGDIKIQNLTYHYPNTIDSILDDISIDIKKGETIGIVGTVGSGKTTLVNLLTRLYEVPNGKIHIDGKDINDIPIETLRNQICYITQDNFLFSASLKENISLFRDDYDEREIEESTKNALISDDIKNMPERLDTIIGERGIDLSGGQKQRVVISRAFLNKSQIVIFDDTFSALDNKTEETLLENVRKLTDGKTCIIISNRISDVNKSDHIYVMDAGKIIEDGIHEDLLERKGMYYDFYKQQSTKSEESFLS